MIGKLILSIVLLSPLLPAALAQADNPSVAILRFGYSIRSGISTTEAAVVDVLQAYGFISEEERPALNTRQDLAGENITILFGDAGFDFADAVLMVETALDQGADVLFTISTPVTQIALNAISDMDDPPKIIFLQVVNPREAGIIQSACIKPANVAGVEARTDYESVLPLLLTQDPDLQIIGTLFNSTEASGVAGAESIAEHGEALGLTVLKTAVTGLSDLRAASQSLVNQGVEIILLPLDETTMAGLPIIAAVANENMIPIFHANTDAVVAGAMVGSGYNLFFEQGVRAGRILVGHLNGEIDIASTGVDSSSGMGIRVNLDVAKELNVEIADELLAMSQAQLEDGRLQIAQGRMMQLIQALGVGPQDMQALVQPLRESVTGARRGRSGGVSEVTVAALKMESSQASYKAFLASLHCTDEMIAEQQAALDAAE